MERTELNEAETIFDTNKPVLLSTPIIRGKTQITEILVNKPNTGALRGVRLAALLEVDVTAISTVLPRITSPTLTKEEIHAMDPADFLELSTKVLGFFTKKSDITDSPNN